eukprot:sb/3470109/
MHETLKRGFVATMATLGIMNKNQGQDTRIYGLHDHLFRRRIDLQREDGDTSFSYPAGTGSGARNALTWHPEPANLAFPTQPGLDLGRGPAPMRVGNTFPRTLGIKSSVIRTMEGVTITQRAPPVNLPLQSLTAVDKRNGVGIATQGDKPYGTPEESASFHTRPIPASAPPALPPSTGPLRRGNPPNLLNLYPSFKWIRAVRHEPTKSRKTDP